MEGSGSSATSEKTSKAQHHVTITTSTQDVDNDKSNNNNFYNNNAQSSTNVGTKVTTFNKGGDAMGDSDNSTIYSPRSPGKSPRDILVANKLAKMAEINPGSELTASPSPPLSSTPTKRKTHKKKAKSSRKERATITNTSMGTWTAMNGGASKKQRVPMLPINDGGQLKPPKRAGFSLQPIMSESGGEGDFEDDDHHTDTGGNREGPSSQKKHRSAIATLVLSPRSKDTHKSKTDSGDNTSSPPHKPKKKKKSATSLGRGQLKMRDEKLRLIKEMAGEMTATESESIGPREGRKRAPIFPAADGDETKDGWKKRRIDQVHTAAKDGNMEVFKAELEEISGQDGGSGMGAFVWRDREGRTALHHATEAGQVAFVASFLTLAAQHAEKEERDKAKREKEKEKEREKEKEVVMEKKHKQKQKDKKKGVTSNSESEGGTRKKKKKGSSRGGSSVNSDSGGSREIVHNPDEVVDKKAKKQKKKSEKKKKQQNSNNSSEGSTANVEGDKGLVKSQSWRESDSKKKQRDGISTNFDSSVEGGDSDAEGGKVVPRKRQQREKKKRVKITKEEKKERERKVKEEKLRLKKEREEKQRKAKEDKQFAKAKAKAIKLAGHEARGRAKMEDSEEDKTTDSSPMLGRVRDRSRSRSRGRGAIGSLGRKKSTADATGQLTPIDEKAAHNNFHLDLNAAVPSSPEHDGAEGRKGRGKISEVMMRIVTPRGAFSAEALPTVVEEKAPSPAPKHVEEYELFDMNMQDYQGRTALIIACRLGQPDMIELLLSNAKCDASIKNNRGDCCLHRLIVHFPTSFEAKNKEYYAKLYKLSQVGMQLTSKGCDPMAANKHGNTPLHLAAMHASPTGVRFLVGRWTSNVNNHNKTGDAPLHLAVRAGCLETVTILLEAGAEESSVSAYGTPLEIARQVNHRDIARLLSKRLSSLGKRGSRILSSALISRSDQDVTERNDIATSILSQKPKDDDIDDEQDPPIMANSFGGDSELSATLQGDRKKGRESLRVKPVRRAPSAPVFIELAPRAPKPDSTIASTDPLVETNALEPISAPTATSTAVEEKPQVEVAAVTTEAATPAAPTASTASTASTTDEKVVPAVPEGETKDVQGSDKSITDPASPIQVSPRSHSSPHSSVHSTRPPLPRRLSVECLRPFDQNATAPSALPTALLTPAGKPPADSETRPASGTLPAIRNSRAGALPQRTTHTRQLSIPASRPASPLASYSSSAHNAPQNTSKERVDAFAPMKITFTGSRTTITYGNSADPARSPPSQRRTIMSGTQGTQNPRVSTTQRRGEMASFTSGSSASGTGSAATGRYVPASTYSPLSRGNFKEDVRQAAEKERRRRIQEIADWLDELALPQSYLNLLVDEGFEDLETIKMVSESDLADIGIDKTGHRKKILKWVMMNPIKQ